MTFADRAAERENDRFYLVRLTPKKNVTDDLSLSGGDYVMDWTLPIEKIQRNGSDLTKVGSSPSSNDEWYWDETNGQLEIQLASAPSSSNVIIVYYQLFYTNERPRDWYQDPDDSGTTIRSWQPRLVAPFPKASQSVRNLLEGVFSIDSTEINLANTDQDFQQYLTLNDSFYRASCKIWICLNSLENRQKIYEGSVSDTIGLTDNLVNIQVDNVFDKLNQPCFMGDGVNEVYYTASGFSGIDPTKRDSPIPFIVGTSSRYRREAVLSGIIQKWDDDFLPEAVCTDFADEAATGSCRDWGLFRAEDIRAPDFGSPTGITHNEGGTSIVALKYSDAEWATLDVDYYDVCEVSGDFRGYATIINPTTKQIALSGASGELSATGDITGASVSGVASPAIAIWPRDESAFYPTVCIPGRQFTLNTTATEGGNNFYSITFDDNFENDSNIGLADPLHPRTQAVFYRAKPTLTGANHADFIQSMLEHVGLTVDSTTFATAKSSLDANCYFQIPQFDESDYGSYLDYLQLILQSTFGILYLNNSFEIEYKLLGSFSSTISVTEDDYLINTWNCEVEYGDIVNQIVAFNPHNAEQPAIGIYQETGSTTVSNDAAKYLHDIEKTIRFRHVLNDISARLQTILDYRSQRRAIYSFQTATQDLAREIGDNLQLEGDNILGSDTEKDIKIITLDKQTDSTFVEASDLEEL